MIAPDDLAWVNASLNCAVLVYAVRVEGRLSKLETNVSWLKNWHAKKNGAADAQKETEE